MKISKKKYTLLNGEIRTNPTSFNKPHLCLKPFLFTPKQTAVISSLGHMNRRRGSNTDSAGHKCLYNIISYDQDDNIMYLHILVNCFMQNHKRKKKIQFSIFIFFIIIF